MSGSPSKQSLEITDVALTKAVQRLVAKNRLAVPRRGFFVIVPIEYRQAGAPPPDWYIGDLMAFSGRQYDVGLLSAASLHGAAHHQPQEIQVIADGQIRPVEAGRGRIRFFTKRGVESTPITVVDVKTDTGLMHVSSPEATARPPRRRRTAAGVFSSTSRSRSKHDPARSHHRLARHRTLGHRRPGRTGPRHQPGAGRSLQRRFRGRELAFRGGTALHKLHLDPPVRYFEDIDLVQTPSFQGRWAQAGSWICACWRS